MYQKIFLEGDLSQSEARIVAALCKDLDWLYAFDTRDLHAEAASFLYSITLQQVLSDKRPTIDTYRYKAKRVGHGTHYRMGPGQLSDIIKCPFGEARKLTDKYYVLHPKLREWQNAVCRQIDKTRIIKTCYDRVIQFFGPISEEVYRAAIAAEPQSTSVSYINEGIVRCWNELPRFDLRLQVHDSMLIAEENNPNALYELAESVKEKVEHIICVQGVDLLIPIEFKIGYCWGKMVKVKNIAEIPRVFDELQIEV
jgi:DNA polymerase I-like protein with 3'-5' exonuclease and polymerase domains